MSVGRLAAFIVILLAAACASFHRLPMPDWQRRDEGALAGVLEAPGEGPVETAAGAVVRRVLGLIAINDEGERDPLQGTRYRVARPTAPVHGPGVDQSGAEKLVDGLAFVVELRASGSDQGVRTLVSRGGWFDFGPLPEGACTLKATVLGWRASVSTITGSDSADADALIRLPWKPAAAEVTR